MTLGDFTLGDTIDFHFTTRRFSTGAPFTLAGTPVISAYEDNSTTQITAGVSITADFDSLTGLNHVRVVATSGNGFESGKSYSLVITTGTVDSISVVGEVVGSFTLERSAAFVRLGAPAGASVSADIAAIEAQTDDIGAAGAGLSAIPWNAAWDAEVQSEVADALAVYDPPTKAELDAAVANVSVDEIQPSALADLFNTDSGTTYASAVAGSVVKEIADNAGGSALTAAAIADEVQTRTIAAVTTVTNLTNAPTNGDLTATMKTSVTTAATAATPTAAAVTGAVGSVTGNVGGNVAGSVGSVAADVTVGTNNDKTGYRLSSTGVDDILDEPIEGVRTLRQYMRGMAAALLAKLSGAETTTVVIRDVDDSKDRVTATVDADGNRSSVTLDLS